MLNIILLNVLCLLWFVILCKVKPGRMGAIHLLVSPFCSARQFYDCQVISVGHETTVMWARAIEFSNDRAFLYFLIDDKCATMNMFPISTVLWMYILQTLLSFIRKQNKFHPLIQIVLKSNTTSGQTWANISTPAFTVKIHRICKIHLHWHRKENMASSERVFLYRQEQKKLDKKGPSN